MAEKPAAVQVGNSHPRIDALQRCLAILVTDQTGANQRRNPERWGKAAS